MILACFFHGVVKRVCWAYGSYLLRIFAGNLLLSGHDVSDGGLITCLLEMAFAGNCGFSVDFALPEPSKSSCCVF